jgi:hypothetical protein
MTQQTEKNLKRNSEAAFLIALLTPLCLRQAVLKPKSGFEK